MKMITRLALLALAAVMLQAQSQPILGEDTVKVSEHVWAIMGFPNIGIVVGRNATLVVDTGLGPRNGATIAKVAQKLAPGNKLYLTTTHFHPEHAGGEGGFPAGTVLIRDKVQQQEIEQHGDEMVRLFAGRNEQQRELLAGVKFRQPDRTFGKEETLDLGGGVKARLLWFGEAHTKGDELTFVEPDKTLISGDVVQNKVVPNIAASGGTPASWIAVLSQVAKLGALHVLPDHSAVGDGSLVRQERAFLADVRTRALESKRKGVSAEEAGKQLTPEIQKKYPDWPIRSLSALVASVYGE
jgi:glyoxylase-like metal-dependent hydrolase (beta-lactamase superfamily II)